MGADTPVVVIACVGSPFGADNLGCAVAPILRNHPVVQSLSTQQLRIDVGDRPQINLLNQLDGAEFAVIVDAVCCRRSPGQLVNINIEDLVTDPERLSSHGVGVAEALALGRALDVLPPRVMVLGMSVGESADWQPETEDLTRLADTIVGEVVQFMEQRTPIASASGCAER